MENYLQVARQLVKEENAQFLLLGTERIRQRATHLSEQLGLNAVNLVEKTNLGEALAMLQFCSSAITEDSGLMHMAWASGIPTVALFGSTNHVWSSPPGNLTANFHSGDLECGACMNAECKYDDVHCLTRITPEMVLRALRELPLKENSTTGIDD
jgi:ADP-heptose:LPS heptosyltransferase